MYWIDTWKYNFFVNPILKMSFIARILGYSKEPEDKPVEKKDESDIHKKI